MEKGTVTCQRYKHLSWHHSAGMVRNDLGKNEGNKGCHANIKHAFRMHLCINTQCKHIHIIVENATL